MGQDAIESRVGRFQSEMRWKLWSETLFIIAKR